MRKSLALLLLAFACSASAQTPPSDLQPIPDPPAPAPAPPSAVTDDSELEPQVTIIKRGEDKVEEYRMHGQLYMIKVTPPHGVPYYLVNERGDGSMVRRDTYDSGLRPPMWVIKNF